MRSKRYSWVRRQVSSFLRTVPAGAHMLCKRIKYRVMFELGGVSCALVWLITWDLNPQHAVRMTAALPIELLIM